MHRFLTGLSFGVGAMILIAGHAYGQTANQCGDRAEVIAGLSKTFGESRQSIGMVNGGRVMEVFASPETGTWTILVTLPNGTSCLLAAGQSFEALREAAAPGEPA